MNWRNHFFVLLITIGIFSSAFFLSNFVNSKKINNIQDAKDKIAIDILSTETRYNLLSTSSCDHLIQNESFETTLTEDLNDLARKLKFIESQLGNENENVLLVKRQYTILQIKDYILVRELAKRCNKHLSTILYFHSNECEGDCRNQSLILDKFHEIFPEIRIYWLDQSLDDPTVKTLISILKIKEVPSLVINGKKYSGLQNIENIVTALPEEFKNKHKDLEQEQVQESGIVPKNSVVQ